MNETLTFDLSVGDVHIAFETPYALTDAQTAEVVSCARFAIELYQRENS